MLISAATVAKLAFNELFLNSNAFNPMDAIAIATLLIEHYRDSIELFSSFLEK